MVYKMRGWWEPAVCRDGVAGRAVLPRRWSAGGARVGRPRGECWMLAPGTGSGQSAIQLPNAK